MRGLRTVSTLILSMSLSLLLPRHSQAWWLHDDKEFKPETTNFKAPITVNAAAKAAAGKIADSKISITASKVSITATATATATPDPAPCCYGNQKYEDGEVVASLPKSCLQILCHDGNITYQYFNQPGDTGCCEFKVTMYPEGAELPGFCWKLVCRANKWIFTDCIDDCCGHCFVHTDPHIVTFDDHPYDFHGTCNYSLVQTDSSYDPVTAVYSDFKPCFGAASCLSRSTFKDNPNTVISLDHSSVFDLDVNGVLFVVPALGIHQVAFPSSGIYHPVLVFRYRGCVVLLGSSRLVVLHCLYRLDVWSHPLHTDDLDGLCGQYNSYARDDLTDREGIVYPLHPNPDLFPVSWKTKDQMDKGCLEKVCRPGDKNCKTAIKSKPLCDVEDPWFKRARKLCTLRLPANPYLLDTCAYDLCVVQRGGYPGPTQELWLKTLVMNADMTTWLDLATTCPDIDTTSATTTPTTTTTEQCQVLSRKCNTMCTNRPLECGPGQVLDSTSCSGEGCWCCIDEPCRQIAKGCVTACTDGRLYCGANQAVNYTLCSGKYCRCCNNEPCKVIAEGCVTACTDGLLSCKLGQKISYDHCSGDHCRCCVSEQCQQIKKGCLTTCASLLLPCKEGQKRSSDHCSGKGCGCCVKIFTTSTTTTTSTSTSTSTSTTTTRNTCQQIEEGCLTPCTNNRLQLCKVGQKRSYDHCSGKDCGCCIKNVEPCDEIKKGCLTPCTSGLVRCIKGQKADSSHCSGDCQCCISALDTFKCQKLSDGCKSDCTKEPLKCPRGETPDSTYCSGEVGCQCCVEHVP